MRNKSIFLYLCYVFLPNLVLCQNIFSRTQLRRNNSPSKGYSGYILDKDSFKFVYFHDQSIVIVEVNSRTKNLINCEIIEVYDENETSNALEEVTEAIREPLKIDFSTMIKLMKECQYLKTTSRSKFYKKRNDNENLKQEQERTSYNTLLNGILPGTKWCGTGDIADTYYDLGTEVKLDKCCRTHDLCPAKIKAHTTRYNVTNASMYTKSHCTCDKMFKNCLKSTKNPTADLMGEFYFNILQVPCIEISTETTKAKFKSSVEY